MDLESPVIFQSSGLFLSPTTQRHQSFAPMNCDMRSISDVIVVMTTHFSHEILKIGFNASLLAMLVAKNVEKLMIFKKVATEKLRAIVRPNFSKNAKANNQPFN